MRAIDINPLSVWDRTWFRPATGHTLGVFRIFFGAFILLILVISFPNWERLYGPDGIINYEFFKQKGNFYYWQCNSKFSLFRLTDASWFVWCIYGVGVLASLCFTLGYQTRLSNVLLFIVFASMFHRNPVIINGQDSLGNLLLFLTCFAPMGACYSIDARNGKSAGLKEASQSVWSWRLMQLSIAIIYFFGGVSKLYDQTWRNGTAVYYISLYDGWFRFPNVEFLHDATLSMALTYAALFIEIGFLFLVWPRRLRMYVVGSAMLLHVGLMIFMAPSIFYFNLLMVIALFLFVPSEIMHGIVSQLTRKGLSRPLGLCRPGLKS